MLTTAIVEAGGSKSHWVIIREGIVVQRLTAAGINAARLAERFLSSKENQALQSVDQLILYAAGYTGKDQDHGLDRLFGKVPSRRYRSDIDAATEAYQIDYGIIALLGTGSQSVLIKDGKIVPGLPSLGYLISDEGSGYAIGRQLMRDYIYRAMPAKSRQWLAESRDMSSRDVLDGLYNQGNPASYVASFAQEVSHLPDQDYATALVTNVFSDFVHLRIVQAFDGVIQSAMPVYAVGGIANAYQSVLSSVCDTAGFRLVNVTDSPIDLIVNTYLNPSNKEKA